MYLDNLGRWFSEHGEEVIVVLYTWFLVIQPSKDYVSGKEIPHSFFVYISGVWTFFSTMLIASPNGILPASGSGWASPRSERWASP